MVIFLPCLPSDRIVTWVWVIVNCFFNLFYIFFDNKKARFLRRAEKARNFYVRIGKISLWEFLGIEPVFPLLSRRAER